MKMGMGSESGTLAQHFLSWQITTGITSRKPTSSLFSASAPGAENNAAGRDLSFAAATATVAGSRGNKQATPRFKRG